MYQIFVQIQAQNVYFLKYSGHDEEFLTVQKLLSKRQTKVTARHISEPIKARE